MSDYDARYYAYYKPVPYAWDQFYWLKFFEIIARRIAVTLHPSSALDVGCAVGFLVGALRAQSVYVEGVDISAYAIGQTPVWLRPYCRLASALAPFGRTYDLITCIEVAEHLPASDAPALIANLCQHAPLVLFSSTPDDTAEPTHLNVRPAAYWETLFFEHGFTWRMDYDATFISPQARLYAAIQL